MALTGGGLGPAALWKVSLPRNEMGFKSLPSQTTPGFWDSVMQPQEQHQTTLFFL